LVAERGFEINFIFFSSLFFFLFFFCFSSFVCCGVSVERFVVVRITQLVFVFVD